ncbi:MAG: hypothetical protein GY714_00565 [Desulfobacterales bacterium]|nr:hypothetical protein [Desulfobacterales bacterium]
MNSLILKPLESIKDSGEYIRLKENLMLQGVVFVHSGPTADYFYFKIKIICNKDSTEDIKINNIDESNGVKYLVQAIKDVTANNYEYPLSGFDIFIENIDYTRSVYSQNEFVDQINKLVHFGFTDLFNHDCLITDLRL